MIVGIPIKDTYYQRHFIESDYMLVGIPTKDTYFLYPVCQLEKYLTGSVGPSLISLPTSSPLLMPI